MASTQTDESGGGAVRKTRFVSASASSRKGTDTPEQTEPAGGLRKRTLVAAVGMGAGALVCFVRSAGFSGGRNAVNGRAAPEISSLREQIRNTEAKTAALPKTDDAERGLTAALTAAGQAEKLQNDYRYVTPGMTAGGGTLDTATAQSTLRSLIPCFAPSVHRVDLGPWYLLASGKDVAADVGVPMSFGSGFEWVAQVSCLVHDASTITVTWLAMETGTGAGGMAAVPAWARADYDLVRKAFLDIQTGTTATGDALKQEVATP